VMHESEKSDFAIVAGKLANKTDPSVAESTEPRAETKGNARRQSTRRAQDRGSVSQALERIREVAKQRKQKKFTSLLHHISPEIMELCGIFGDGVNQAADFFSDATSIP
jgi:hypothetical protein